MRIANNIMAMNTHRAYTTNNDKIAASAEKLSSGYRINKAGDDAAGLAISEKMRAQIRGLNMAKRNSQDAISLIQTAEGALQEVHSMLQRMNELANQSATGTNEAFDREQIAKEFEQLKREVNDISEQTTFNNMKILDGSLSATGVMANRSDYTSGIYSTFVKETPTSEPGGIKTVSLSPGKFYQKASDAAFTIDLGNVSYAGTNGQFELKIGTESVFVQLDTDSTKSDIATAVCNAIGDKGIVIDGATYKVTKNPNGTLTFRTDGNITKDIALKDLENMSISFSGSKGFKGASGVSQTVSDIVSGTTSVTASFSIDLTDLELEGATSSGEIEIKIGGVPIKTTITGAATDGDISKKLADSNTSVTINGTKYNISVTNNTKLLFTADEKKEISEEELQALRVSLSAKNTSPGTTGFAGSVKTDTTDVSPGKAKVDGTRSESRFDFVYEQIKNGDALTIGSNKFIFGNKVTDPEGYAELEKTGKGAIMVDLSEVTSAYDFKNFINKTQGIMDSNATVETRPPQLGAGSIVATMDKGQIVITYAGTQGSSGSDANNANTNNTTYSPYGPAGDKYVAVNSTPYNPKEAGKTTFEVDLDKLKPGDTVKWVNDQGNEQSLTITTGTTMEDIRGLIDEKYRADFDGNSWSITGIEDFSSRLSVDVADDFTKYDVMKIQIGALEGEQLSIKIAAMNTKGLALDEAEIYTQESAGKAITSTRAAINMVSDQRARLGAMQNRMNHKINNLAVSAENLQAAESRIRDIDIAQEMTKHTQANILSQAATAMLAQANAAPQNVLSLLK